MNAWQEIGTAPKDGTRVLVFIPATIPMVCWYEKSRASWITNGYTILTFDPTHWMPLPEQPLSDSKGSQS